MAICEKCKNYEKEIQGCLYMDADCVNGSMFELQYEKIKAIRPQIIVTGTIEKPYYEILYFDTSDNVWHIGYSSYILANVIKWKEEWFEVVGEIEDMHPTADVVEVVRCKDCKHRSTDDFYSFYCRRDDVECKDDDFCSYGVKKNDFKES